MEVSVGREDAGPLPHAAETKITFLVFDWIALWSGIAALIAAIVVLMIGARHFAILRDGDNASAFSLGRCQMAWWLYLVTASFVYILLVTGQVSSVLTSDALVLLGISGPTGLAAMFIPSQPPAPASASSQKKGMQSFWTTS